MNCPKFKERLDTLRVQHAVAQGGQRIFLLVFTSLFKGVDLTDIKGYVISQLPSNRKYKDAFTKPEQEKLDIGNYMEWDISLLFKLFRIVCGLHPNVSEWKTLGRDTLEKLLDELKDLRNINAHDLNCILTKEERNQQLEELRNLCIEILIKLGEKAQIDQTVISQHEECIASIIEDAQKEINESLVGNAQSVSAAGAMSKAASAVAASSAFGFAAGSTASSFSPAAAASACADFLFGGGFKPDASSLVEYHHDGAEAMDVDDSYASSSREASMIEELKSSILKYAGPGWITVE